MRICLATGCCDGEQASSTDVNPGASPVVKTNVSVIWADVPKVVLLSHTGIERSASLVTLPQGC